MIRSHYIPKYYLKGFCNPDGKIFRYEKGSNKVICTSIENVAQEKGFYSKSTENDLANQVEAPANALLSQLRQRQMIAPGDKTVLAEYMANMMKRVPRGWERARKAVSGIVDSGLRQLDEEFRDRIKANPDKRYELEKRWQELRAHMAEWEDDPPREIWYYALQLKKTPRVVETISRLVWEFYTSEPPVFLTSDNPVFYPEAIGIGSARAVVSFPMSSNIALEATNLVSRGLTFYAASRDRVQQINQRTVQAATHYVFHCEEAQWVLSLMNG